MLYPHKEFANSHGHSTLLALPAIGLVTNAQVSEVLANNLRQTRHYLKLSQRELAEKLGLKQPTYAAYEELRADPPLATLVRIASAFGVKLDDLFSPKAARPHANQQPV